MSFFVYPAPHNVKSFSSFSVSYSQCSMTQVSDIYQQKSEINHSHQYFAFTQISLSIEGLSLSFQSFEYSSLFISNSGGILRSTLQECSFSFKLTLSFSIESYAFFGSQGDNYQAAKQQHNNEQFVFDVAGKELSTPKLIGEEKIVTPTLPPHPKYTPSYVPNFVTANQPTTPEPITGDRENGRSNKGGKPSHEQKGELAGNETTQPHSTKLGLTPKEIPAPNSKLGGLTFLPNLKLRHVSKANGRPEDLPDHTNLGGKFTKAGDHQFVDPSSFRRSQSEKEPGTHTRALNEARASSNGKNILGKQ
jgi:hypothetical protein